MNNDKIITINLSNKSIYESFTTGIILTDKYGIIIYCNKYFEQMVQYSSKELVNKETPVLFHNKKELHSYSEKLANDFNQPIIDDFDALIFKTKQGFSSVNQWNYIKKNGENFFAVVSSVTVNINNEIAYLFMIRDITKEKNTEDKIKKLSIAVEQSGNMILITDINGKIEYANKKLLLITQYSLNELIGKNPKILNSGQQSKSYYENMWKNILSGKEWKGEFHNKKKNGDFYWNSVIIAPIFDENTVTHFVAIGEDITEKKELEEKIINFATIDSLTNTYNRRMCFEFLEQQMKFATRNKTPLTICFIDVNNLKIINDKLGHKYGDDLIITVSNILKQSKRDSDLLCRLGGDEFLMILPNSNLSNCEFLWERILNNIDDYNKKSSKIYNISLSHGFAEYNKEEITVDEFISLADKEMYKEKIIIKKRRTKDV